MPNWVYNTLVVEGSTAARKQFLAAQSALEVEYSQDSIPEFFRRPSAPAQMEKFTFEATVPTPAKILEAGYDPYGYDWCCKNWGTKWDASDVVIRNTRDKLTIDFSTAWSSPLPWFMALAQRHSTLDIALHSIEEQPSFVASWYASKGEVRVQDYTPFMNDNTLTADMAREIITNFHGPIVNALHLSPAVYTDPTIRRYILSRVDESTYLVPAILPYLNIQSRSRLLLSMLLNPDTAMEIIEAYGDETIPLALSLTPTALAALFRTMSSSSEHDARALGIRLLGTLSPQSRAATTRAYKKAIRSPSR